MAVEQVGDCIEPFSRHIDQEEHRADVFRSAGVMQRFRNYGNKYPARLDHLMIGPGLIAFTPQERAVAAGLKVGLVIGVVTALADPLTPFIEWLADHMPARRMGAFASV